MKRCIFEVHFQLIIVVLTLSSGLGFARTIAVGDSMRELIEADWTDHDNLFVATRAAIHRSSTKHTVKINARGVTTVQDAVGGCDGIKNGRWGFHTASGEQDPWWQVDLGKEYKLGRLVIFNRTDRGTASRTRYIRVLVSREGEGREFREIYQHNGQTFYGVKENKPLMVNLLDRNITAQIVQLQVPGRCSFALDEVEVYSADDPTKNIALGKPADQKSIGPYSYPGTMGQTNIAAALQLAQSGGFLLAHTREVVERGHKLAERLRSETAPDSQLKRLMIELKQLNRRLGEVEASENVPVNVRRKIYFEARWLKRRIAFCNPLLNFDRLLFIKRHDPGGVYHMCDQYYGFNGIAGGGLFVLSDPFEPNPKLTNLLENSVVQKGRLKGRKLTGGVFLSPELSYDGKTILFAYCQGKGKDLEWTAQSCYHIFKVNSDGTGLVQLTDGPWNDFDPCILPNGRIVFISERRGGYLRCGRHCPTYTMYSMAPDGSDIICLSFHETHEWHPSVNNDGRIVYTRWDYVDRDTNIAHHHIWTCFPDGRDPRSLHGNYPLRRENRPWMEMSIRAIPGSHKYVSTAAAHHGHAFGSLVMIDHQLTDDRSMSQLTRLTPEVPFPEAEKHIKPIKDCMVYGTPWPLSEDDYLCVYDAGAKNHGIYWVDRFGNRELIYRDPSIPCLSPSPLRPRSTRL